LGGPHEKVERTAPFLLEAGEKESFPCPGISLALWGLCELEQFRMGFHYLFFALGGRFLLDGMGDRSSSRILKNEFEDLSGERSFL
jgi:hypothetical protein